GKKFTMTTFGESHGIGIGCIVDGVPAGLKIDEEFIQDELNRRKPGKSPLETGRKEDDKVEILSGVFDGVSTGTPIAMVIYNTNQKSGDYENVKNLFRPAHADLTYFHKYGLRDYRGGGRSSARETAARVAAGAIAKLMLKEIGITVEAGISSIGNIEASSHDFEYAKKSKLFALDKSVEDSQEKLIMDIKNAHDSIGGTVVTKVSGVPVGLGEPLYYKLDGTIAEAMMGINAVKAVEIGDGITSSKVKGSQNNDQITKNGFSSNHSGGILGGISNGDEIVVKTYFKPTPSIFQEQQTVDTQGNEVSCNLKGRHDPCVAIRGVVVCEAMMAIVIADMALLNMSSKMQNIKSIYNK
ncbi:MAG: chorismate synthase, partial [Sulfurovaceae bacterium]|nr:chorismate synthase [Sulfurovaceae bacterium]